MSKKKPGSKYAIKLGRDRYQKEMERARINRANRKEHRNDNDTT